jgi:hypothetical protein
MNKHTIEFTVAATISVFGLVINYSQAKAAALYIGRYGYFTKDINLVSFIPESKLIEQITNSQNKNFIIVDRHQIQISTLMNKIEVLAPGNPLKKQIEQEFTDFQSQANNQNINSNTKQKSRDLTGIANPELINQNIEARYQGLIETKSEKIDLFVASNINKQLLGEETEKQKSPESLIAQISTTEDNNKLFPKSLTARVILIIGGVGFIVLVPLINAFFTLDERGNLIFSGWNFGKTKIPETAIALHDKTFTEISNLAKKAEKINDEKFSNKE